MRLANPSEEFGEAGVGHEGQGEPRLPRPTDLPRRVLRDETEIDCAPEDGRDPRQEPIPRRPGRVRLGEQEVLDVRRVDVAERASPEVGDDLVADERLATLERRLGQVLLRELEERLGERLEEDLAPGPLAEEVAPVDVARQAMGVRDRGLPVDAAVSDNLASADAKPYVESGPKLGATSAVRVLDGAAAAEDVSERSAARHGEGSEERAVAPRKRSASTL